METGQQQARNRPESMIARNFSEDLDSLFGLHSGVTIGNLNQTVQEKKRTVSTQEQELAELESRIRETEELLAQAAGTSSDGDSERQASAGAEESPEKSSRREQSTARSFSNQQQSSSGNLAATSRPTANREESFHPHIPGAMPITPTPRFEGRDYVTVDRTR